MNRQERIEGDRGRERESEGEREEHKVQPSLRSRKVRKSEFCRCWEQKKYMAPGRAGECHLDQRQKKAGLRKGMHMMKEQSPRAGEGLEVGQLLCDNRTAPAGSPYFCSLMDFYWLLNWFCSRERIGDIGISSGTSCISPQVPPARVLHAVLTWAQQASSNLWVAAVGTAAEMRKGLKPQQRETRASGGERREVTRLTARPLIDSQTNRKVGHPTVLTVTNFFRYSADICSRDKNPSGHSREQFVHSALPSLREKLPDFWHPFRLQLC